MRIHITGASGFLGGHVTPLLVERGHQVSALVRSPESARRVVALGAHPIPGDLADARSLDDAFVSSDAEALMNLASLGFGHAEAIVAAAQKAGLTKAVFVSSTSVLTSLDVSSKVVRLAAEDTIRKSSLAWTIIRPTMIYGTAGDRNLARLLRLLRRSPVLPMPGGGERLQQPVHVGDLAQAVVAALERSSAVGNTYIVAGPEALSFRELVETSAAAVGRRPRLIPVPLGAAVGAVRTYERVARRPRLKAEQLQRLGEDKAFDIGAARRELGYDPRPFSEGIAQEAALLARGPSGPPRAGVRGPSGPSRAGVRGPSGPPRAGSMPDSAVGHALLVARTVRHLRPAQVAHRVRLRTQRAVLSRLPSPVEAVLRTRPRSVPGWPSGFRALDARLAQGYPSPEDNARQVYRFLNETRRLGTPPDWGQRSAPRLWRYHLHYYEWAWSFAAHPDRGWARQEFARTWRSWREGTPFGRVDEWSPYVTSLRAWALCGVYAPLVLETEMEAEFASDLSLHARFLRAHLELDVGGNHLVKNLKALVGLGIFLGDDRLLTLARRHLAKQLEIQVLADGGHFERSPSYHCQVLGDLIDIDALLVAGGAAPIVGMQPAIAAMRLWLGTMLLPDGEVPMFNDGQTVGCERLALLGPVPPSNDQLIVLEPSGFVVIRPNGRLHLVADVGLPCPPELPAHAHADCLSFELAVGRQRVITDTGTSTYEPGAQRAYERSTRAHNTMEVDGEDQTEVWGTFRAARRACPAIESAARRGDVIELVASHDGYRRLRGRPLHQRTWRVSAGRVEVSDQITGTGAHRMVGRLHLAPTLHARPLSEGRFEVGPVSVTLLGGRASLESGVTMAMDFGGAVASTCLVTSAETTLPHSLTTIIDVHPSPSGGAT